MKELNRRQPRKGFFKVKHSFIEMDARALKPNATLVYLAISSHAQGKAYSFPSHKLLAEELGVSTKTIQRATKKLEKAGYMKTKRRSSGNGGRISNIYYPCKRTNSPPLEDQ